MLICRDRHRQVQPTKKSLLLGAQTGGPQNSGFEVELFRLAQTKRIEVDEIYNRLPKRILKAFALVVLDEVNLLRSQPGLAARTAGQLRIAVKSKLKNL